MAGFKLTLVRRSNCSHRTRDMKSPRTIFRVTALFHRGFRGGNGVGWEEGLMRVVNCTLFKIRFPGKSRRSVGLIVGVCRAGNGAGWRPACADFASL
jgi:hypothetical protein